MSEWTFVGKDDIDIDGEDINILYGSDSEGNKYVEIKVSDVLELIKESQDGDT